ncbi:MAG: beta-galactosidase trimerization domain-containing protein [Armatimonadetes bacterium]|nr:beta-galactosidase trimerization domain-containing protein [Armatimonadota bacterium]
MSNWFADHIRKVHILYVSPDWAKRRGERFDAHRMADSLAEARVDCVQFYCKDHHGICYYPCTSGLPYDFDVIGPMVEACHDVGVKFMAYFSVGFDNYALGVHRDWIHVKPDGESWRMGPFYFGCLASPYGDFSLAQFEQLAAAYPIDGVWLDIIPIAWRDYEKPVYGWWHGELSHVCHCVHCHRRFYSEFGRDLPWEPNEEEQMDLFHFGVKGVAKYLRDAHAVIRRHRPEAVVTYNNAGVPQDPVFMSDLATVEAHAPFYKNQSWAARSSRACGKPFEVLMPGALRGWNGFDQKPASLIQLETAIPASHGGTATVGVIGRPDGSLEPGALDAIRDSFLRLEKLEPHLTHTQPVSDVGLLLLVDPLNAPQQGVPHLVEAHAFHNVMVQDHVQYEVVYSTEDLSRFRAVVAPNLTAISGCDAQNVRDYVGGGGRLLATGQLGVSSSNGPTPPTPALADLAGFSDLSWAPWPYAFVRRGASDLFEGIPDVPVRIAGPVALLSGLTGEVLAEVQLPEAPPTVNTTLLWHEPAGDEDRSYPYVVRNSYGNGVCIYAASALASSTTTFDGIAGGWANELARRLLRLLLPYEERSLSIDAPPGCEVVLNRKDGRLVISLINHYAGHPDYLPTGEAGVRLGPFNLVLRTDVTGPVVAQVQPEGDQLPSVTEGSTTRLTVPAFDVHKVISITSRSR